MQFVTDMSKIQILDHQNLTKNEIHDMHKTPCPQVSTSMGLSANDTKLLQLILFSQILAKMCKKIWFFASGSILTPTHI